MQWNHFENFDKLPVLELYQMLKLRQDVFIIEQQCIYDDIDDLDPLSEHILLKTGNELIGCSRIVPANLKFEKPSIGRVAVHADYRGKGYGKKIVMKSLDILSKRNIDSTVIEAQTYLQTFYESVGFRKMSDPYPVDGISHIEMHFKFTS